jgi:hypothetical protein
LQNIKCELIKWGFSTNPLAVVWPLLPADSLCDRVCDCAYARRRRIDWRAKLFSDSYSSTDCISNKFKKVNKVFWIYTVAQKKWEFCQQRKHAQTVSSCKNKKVRMHVLLHAHSVTWWIAYCRPQLDHPVRCTSDGRPTDQSDTATSTCSANEVDLQHCDQHMCSNLCCCFYETWGGLYA